MNSEYTCKRDVEQLRTALRGAQVIGETNVWNKFLTVAILAQGTSWAVADTQAFLQYWAEIESSRGHVELETVRNEQGSRRNL